MCGPTSVHMDDGFKITQFTHTWRPRGGQAGIRQHLIKDRNSRAPSRPEEVSFRVHLAAELCSSSSLDPGDAFDSCVNCRRRASRVTYDTSRPSIICSAAELVRDFEVLSVTGR